MHGWADRQTGRQRRVASRQICRETGSVLLALCTPSPTSPPLTPASHSVWCGCSRDTQREHLSGSSDPLCREVGLWDAPVGDPLGCQLTVRTNPPQVPLHWRSKGAVGPEALLLLLPVLLNVLGCRLTY